MQGVSRVIQSQWRQAPAQEPKPQRPAHQQTKNERVPQTTSAKINFIWQA